MWFANPSSQWTLTTYSLPISRRTPHTALNPSKLDVQLIELCLQLGVGGTSLRHERIQLRVRRFLSGADFAEKAQGKAFSFVSHERNVSLARCFVNMELGAH